MKNKIDSLFGSAIDTIFWFLTWGAVIYFFLCMGAMLVSAAPRGKDASHWANRDPVVKKRIIALTILGEARGEGKEGMHAVACVIQQRAKNRKMKLVDVCLQKKQFSIWNGVRGISKLHYLLKSPSAIYAKELASEMAKGKKLNQSKTKNADHYHAANVNPSWANINKKTVKIGNHIFYKLKK
jgi:N-acetylmuramoyl-L-alanine amidase